VTFEGVVRACVLGCGVYLAVLYTAYTWLLALAFVETRRRRRERAVDDLDVLAESRFAAGVSIIVPAFNESAGLPRTVRSLLALDYPEFEVIVVNDGSTDDTLARLVREFDLVPAQTTSRDIVSTAVTEGYYRTAADRRLLVIDKRNAGKADALNVGLNHCRYRYVCGVDADMVLARGALSRAMREIARDPGVVVGLTSYFESSRDPAASLPDGVRFVGPETRPLFAFQTFDYLRSFFNNRTPWARMNFMLCTAGAFQLWRRDLLEELGGWEPRFTCEDIEFTFRAHRVLRERRRNYRIACLPDCIGVTEGPASVRKLVAQRERWQRVILETCWANKRMWFNPRYGTVGMLGVPFYVVSEILAPIFEVLAIATLLAGGVTGLIAWSDFAVFTLLVVFANSALTTAALLMLDLEARAYRPSGIAWLLALMPVELLVYRPIMGWARVKGTWRFLRRDRAWHKFERNVRTEAT
jgi:cellulose synthase/poly-beta-1,6-N-acetylglucosamine synthase-like glycosyltransferase